jgi:hypothetical protein
MRITVLAISLTSFLTLGFEWLAVGIHGLGASIGAGHGFEKGASACAAVAFLYLIGAAFAMGRPLVSSAEFSLAALVGIAAGMWTAYSGFRMGLACRSLGGVVSVGLSGAENQAAWRPAFEQRQLSIARLLPFKSVSGCVEAAEILLQTDFSSLVLDARLGPAKSPGNF